MSSAATPILSSTITPTSVALTIGSHRAATRLALDQIVVGARHA
jgi:hypothetical protein